MLILYNWHWRNFWSFWRSIENFREIWWIFQCCNFFVKLSGFTKFLSLTMKFLWNRVFSRNFYRQNMLKCVLSCIVKVNEMHFRNLWSGRIGLLHPSGCLFHPSGSKNSSLGPSALGMNLFFPWDEIHPSGCKTQFFLSASYEIPQFLSKDSVKPISLNTSSRYIAHFGKVP